MVVQDMGIEETFAESVISRRDGYPGQAMLYSSREAVPNEWRYVERCDGCR